MQQRVFLLSRNCLKNYVHVALPFFDSMQGREDLELLGRR